jgi:hypothetical protein
MIAATRRKAWSDEGLAKGKVSKKEDGKRWHRARKQVEFVLPVPEPEKNMLPVPGPEKKKKTTSKTSWWKR